MLVAPWSPVRRPEYVVKELVVCGFVPINYSSSGVNGWLGEPRGDVVAWSVLAMASGSRSGMSLDSAFHRVSVLLPAPLATAMKVSLGRIT